MYVLPEGHRSVVGKGGKVSAVKQELMLEDVGASGSDILGEIEWDLGDESDELKDYPVLLTCAYY